MKHLTFVGIACFSVWVGTCSSADPQPVKAPQPLLQKWLMTVKKKETPRFPEVLKRYQSPLSTLPDLDDLAVVSFLAKLNPSRGEVLSRTAFAPSLTALSNDDLTDLFCLSSATTKRLLVPPKGGLLLFRGGRSFLAVREEADATGSSKTKPQTQARVVELRLQGSNVKLLPSHEKAEGFSQIYHEKEKLLYVHDLLTDKPLVAFPANPANDDYFSSDYDVRRMGKHLEAAGTEWSYKIGNRLVWLSRSAGGSSWRVVHRPLDEEYHHLFLPKSLWQMTLELDDNPLYPRLWKDGSIILRFEAAERQGNETLTCRGLIGQPRQGKPRLLAWAVYYANRAPNDAPRPAAPRVWYPEEKGTVTSHVQVTSPSNDFRYDIDDGSNSLIYLLNGQMWVIPLR